MTVFRLFLRIIKANLASMAIFGFVFLLLTVVISRAGGDLQSMNFKQNKINIVIASNTDNSLVDGLGQVLSSIAQVRTGKFENKYLQDGLFSRRFDYILEIPDDFADRLLRGEKPKLRAYSGPSEANTAYAEQRIKQYVNLVSLYAASRPAGKADELLTALLPILGLEAGLVMEDKTENRSDYFYLAMYFNYMAYSLLAVLMLGISTAIMVFNQADVRRRYNCAPLKAATLSFQMIKAMLVFSVACLIVLVLCSILIHGFGSSPAHLLLFILNAFVLTLWGLCLSYLIGNLVHSRNMLIGLTHVITLGSSFVSGVFIPQMLLGDTLLDIARFLPVFWYVQANNHIINIGNFSFGGLSKLGMPFLVQLLFALLFLVMGLGVNVRKRRTA